MVFANTSLLRVSLLLKRDSVVVVALLITTIPTDVAVSVQGVGCLGVGGIQNCDGTGCKAKSSG